MIDMLITAIRKEVLEGRSKFAPTQDPVVSLIRRAICWKNKGGLVKVRERRNILRKL